MFVLPPHEIVVQLINSCHNDYKLDYHGGTVWLGYLLHKKKHLRVCYINTWYADGAVSLRFANIYDTRIELSDPQFELKFKSFIKLYELKILNNGNNL